MLTEKTIDRDSQQKLYVQMYSIIKEKIESGEWPAGSQIPTEDELCRSHDVSKAPVRMAIAELVRSGYLRKKQGRGTFVSPSLPDRGITMKTKLTEDMFGEGVVAKKEVLVKGVKVPPQDVRNYLRADGDIYYVLCKRVVDGEPAYLEESFIPLDVVPDIDEVDICQTPFYEMMQQKAATKIQKVVQMIEIAEMTGDAASILKSGKGSSMLMLHRLLVGADGKPLAYTRLMGDGKKYKLQTEMIQIA
jgi:DNA-binding GntR family transcriptional regulator